MKQFFLSAKSEHDDDSSSDDSSDVRHYCPCGYPVEHQSFHRRRFSLVARRQSKTYKAPVRIARVCITNKTRINHIVFFGMMFLFFNLLV